MLETFLAQCSQVAVPEASDLALRYYKSGNILWIVQQFWSLALPFLFLVTGWSGKIGTMAHRIGRKWYFSLVLYLIVILALFALFNFPLDLYSGYMRGHEYGLSNQSFGRWFNHWIKALLISFIAFAAFLWIFYLLLKKSPRRWWFYGSLVSIAIAFFSIFITPIWVAPLFNRFGPMKNTELEQQILTLASRSGIEGARVYEVDMSQDTKALNAYVTGLGSSKRIVLWDTTIQRLTPDEILFVMGHEMGHYVLHHIWWLLAFLSLLTLVIFYLTYRTSHYLLARFHQRFGFRHLYEFASFPLLILVFTFYQLLASPIMNAFGRHLEHNADIFGLEITQNNEAAAKAFIALQQENLGNPWPGKIFTFWRGTHPCLGSRIEFCNTYCPWAKGEKLKYGKYFSSEE